MRVQSLTSDNIRFFYQQEADSYKWPLGRFRTFMRSSMTDNFLADSTTTINFPGKPAQVQPSTQNKNSVLSHAEGEYDMMQGAHLAINLGDIQIAPDARSAVVQYHSEARDMALHYGGAGAMSADSKGDCTDTLVLNPQGDIQIKNTKCVSTMSVVTGISGDAQ